MIKSKMVLSVVAIILVSTLVVSGTVMFVTAKTETATNVVALSPGIEAQLEEKGNDEQMKGKTKDDGYVVIVSDGDGDGINFSNVVPNQKLVKVPRVVRTDMSSMNTYVAVKVQFNSTVSSASEPDDFLKLQEAIMVGIVYDTNPNWKYVYDNDNNVGWFFYTEDDNNHLLKTISGSDPTSDIFSTIQLPVLSGANAEEYASLSDGDFELDLTAYLVQADNNTLYPPSISQGQLSDYLSAFPNI